MTSTPRGTARTSGLRLPEGRGDKARTYIALAEGDLAAGRLQSAESFLRLAIATDPSSDRGPSLLKVVLDRRATRGAPRPT
ncbi:MAG: hypothetical protein IAE78_09730 [Myxococcus sp.]|nr:hypothetical protein [Myxococcus sp.]